MKKNDMCLCTPEKRTPFCGKEGCEKPATMAETIMKLKENNIRIENCKCGQILKVNGIEVVLHHEYFCRNKLTSHVKQQTDWWEKLAHERPEDGQEVYFPEAVARRH